MITDPDFPRLTLLNHRVTSPATPDYNCIGWAAGDAANWWEPGVYWPMTIPPNDHGIGILEMTFKAQGYFDCNRDESLEPGYLKIALYGSFLYYSHAARQLPSGKWTSKLGKGEDIEHDSPDDVAGGIYGDVVQIMKRQHTPVAANQQ